MSVEDVRAELELDLAWRIDELRLLTNQLGLIGADADRERYCRSLVVMLYAHVEGFTKLAMKTYLQAVVAEKCCVGVLDIKLGANLIEPLIASIENSKAHSFFKVVPPPKEKLTKTLRLTELLGRWQEIQKMPFEPNLDVITDTDSNLKRTVLRRILYRSGFELDEFLAFEDDLQKLVERRNPIAHGEIKTPVKHDDYVRMETGVLLYMEALVRALTLALREKRYLSMAERMSSPQI